MSSESFKDCFSESYFQARDRFRSAAARHDASLIALATDCDEQLTMDIAVLGNRNSDRALVVSSGLHGVEGFLGSAVQLAWLDKFVGSNIRIVLIHALNPFGYANLRRWNENNVDLNRNFFSDDDPNAFRSNNDAYAKLNNLLNPKSPPSKWDFFTLKALWVIARMGMPVVKQAVASGQYEFPKGLFFGGKISNWTAQCVQTHFPNWIGSASEIIHLDYHTGLGKWGDCVLLLEDDASSDWFANACPSTRREITDNTATAYRSSGSMGAYLLKTMSHLNYRFGLVEYGTHDSVKVVSALRSENQTHFYADANSDTTRSTKNILLECFCPADARWRAQVLEHGFGLIDQTHTYLRDALSV